MGLALIDQYSKEEFNQIVLLSTNYKEVASSKTKIDGISLIRPTEYNSGLFYFNYIFMYFEKLW